MFIADLLGMKYSELQKLAKSYGIKANQKSEKLVEALRLVVNGNGEVNKKEAIKEDEPHKRDKNDQESKIIVERPDNQTMSPTMQKQGLIIETERSSPQKLICTPISHVSVTQPYEDHSTPESSSIKKETLVNAEKAQHFELMENPSSGKESRRSSQRRENLTRLPIQEKHLLVKERKRPHDPSETEKSEPMRKRLRSSLKTNGDAPEPHSNVPRHSKLLKGHKKNAEYWSKIHQKMQNKMESIDEYQKNKQSRAAILLSGCKENKAQVRRSPRLTAVVKPLSSKVFVPDISTMDKMDLNFSEKPLNTFFRDKSSGFKTPKNLRQSLCTKNVSSMKTSMLSPKVMNASLSSASKQKFDLAASLERPLTWVPHKGKIKPFIESNRFRVDIKEVKAKSRTERMNEAKLEWRSKRASELMKKRNANVHV